MIRLKVWGKVRQGQKDNLHQHLRNNEATLHIVKPDYAILEVDDMRYYFHNSNPRVTRYEDIETLGGEKLKKSLVPYDGWEKSL